jgi:hypothetical protein
MSGSTQRTYVWEPTQAIEAGNHLAAAVSAELEGYEPGRMLTLMQGNKGQLRVVIAAALKGFVASLTSPFKYDRTKDGWGLISPEKDANCYIWMVDETAHGLAVPKSWDPTRIPELLEEITFNREGEEGPIGGLETWRRALYELGCPDGQLLAEWLLENQQYIPESWRDHCLVFPGTVWLDCGGELNVTVLRWYDECWNHQFCYLLHRSIALCHLVRRCGSSI